MRFSLRHQILDTHVGEEETRRTNRERFSRTLKRPFWSILRILDSFLVNYRFREARHQGLADPATIGKTGKLSRRALVRTDAADMLKRRLKRAELPAHYSPHSFRATGITNFLANDRTLEAAQRIADHADSRTTKLYDRRGQKVLLEDMERIRY